MRYGDVMEPLNLADLALADEMRADPDVLQYVVMLDRTMRAEKVSDPGEWTPEETAAYRSGEYETFSRLRGYTDAEIRDFNSQLALGSKLIERYGEDDVAWIGYLVQEQTGILGATPRKLLRRGPSS